MLTTVNLGSTMKNNSAKNKKRPNPMGLRVPPEFRETIEKIAHEEGRTLSNTVVYIVNQYLSSTNGKLLKHVKVVPVDGSAA